MIWNTIIVLIAAVLAYFIPTPKEMQDVFLGGQNLMASSNYRKAIEQYEIIINTQSDFLEEDSVKVTIMSGDLTIGVVAAAYYQKANALRQLQMLDSAITVFRIVENRRDEPVLAALSQFQIYDIYYAQSKFPESIKEARKLADKYPDNKKAEAALYDIGWAYRELHTLDSSNAAFIELINKYQQTEFLSKALYQLGQNNYELGNYSAAIYYWSDLGVRFKPEAFKDQEWEKVQLKAVRERQIFEASSKRETDASTLELVAKSQVKIGDAFQKMDNYDSAMIAYKRVVSAYTLLPQLLEVTYIKMADYTKAVKGIAQAEGIYRTAIDACFQNKELQAKFQFKIADMYQNDNQYEKAAEEFLFYSRAYREIAANINFTVEDALYSRIVCLYNAEKYSSTVASVDSFVVQNPSSSYCYDLSYLKAVSQFLQKDYSAAQTTFGSVIEQNPGGNFYVPANVYLGRIYLEGKQDLTAVEHFRKILAERPGTKYSDEMNYYLLQGLYEIKQLDSIPAVFTNINPKSVYFSPTIIKTSKSFTLQKKYAEGETFMKRVLALSDSLKDSVDFRPEAYFAMADLYMQMAKYDTSALFLIPVIENPKTNELLKLQSIYLRGTIYSQINKYDNAIKDLEYVLNNSTFQEKMKPLLPNARGRLATSYTKTNQQQKGIDLMTQYIASSSDSLEKARYMIALADVYFEMKNYDKLIPVGEQLIAMDVPDEYIYSRAVYLTAVSYNIKNNFDKSLALFTKGMDKYPDVNQDVFFNFAVNLYDMAYYKNAAAAFTKYIEKYPKSLNAKNSLFFTAYANYKLGEWASAVESFQNFIKSYPTDPYASESQYNIAEARYNQGNFQEAVKEYQQVYTRYPKSDYAANAVYNEAWSYYQLKEMDKMIIPLQKLIKDYPKHQLVAEAQFTLGDYYYNKKDYTKALAEYRTFIEKFPEHARTEEARSFITELSQIDAFKDYQKAIVLFDKQDWQNAINELQKIVDKYPATEIAMACEANIASSYEQLKNMTKALELFKNIVQKYKDNPLASGIVFFAQQHVEWIEGDATASK